MLFTFLAVLAASPTAAVRPELVRASMSSNVARVKSIISDISSPIESKAALQAAAGIVDGILAETGNATEHMSDDDAALLREVIDLIEKSIYGSMDSAHAADEKALADGLAAVEACNADITARQAPTGDLGKLHTSVSDDQSELNRLQGVVDDETSNNASAWDTFDNHMQMISESPGCPAFPSRTMPALDVYFEKSDYAVWFTTQSKAYADAKVLWTAADAALADALENYKIQKAIRDTQYCDWKDELIAACASFDECFADTSEDFNKRLVPRVQSDMNSRIDNYKAGETLVHQIKFLLADVKDQETPAIATSRYELDFPVLPPKGECDVSVLDDAKWVPQPPPCPGCAPPFVSCACWGDPHCTRSFFTNKKFNFQGLGLFRYAVSLDSSFEVQTFQCKWHAKSRASVINAMAVKADGHVVTLTDLDGFAVDGVGHSAGGPLPAGARLTNGKRGLEWEGEFFNFFTKRSFHHRHKIIIHRMDIEIVGSKVSSEGMCGNPDAGRETIPDSESLFSPDELSELYTRCGLTPGQHDADASDPTNAEVCEGEGIALADAEHACRSLKDQDDFFQGCVFDFCAGARDAEMVDEAEGEKQTLENRQRLFSLRTCDDA